MDSVFEIDKCYYSQILLKECKYAIKENKWLLNLLLMSLMKRFLIKRFLRKRFMRNNKLKQLIVSLFKYAWQTETKQKQNHDKYRCECKNLVDWNSSKDDYTCNPSTGNCGCDKACKVGEYPDIKNCSCKKWLFDKLVLACEDEILNTGETT